MQRTRDWRRARTRAVWRKRETMALVNPGFSGGNLDATHPRWRETPERCPCVQCEVRREWLANRNGSVDQREIWADAQEVQP